MQVPRVSHASCFLGGYIYAFGGNAAGEWLNSIEKIKFIDEDPAE